MNLLHLRYFYEVARSQSFTESARGLRVSQPAISKMVRSLEQDLGHVLLERGRGGARLTEAGEVLFESASRIFAEAARAEEALRSGEREFAGEWTLGASDNLAIHLIPRVLGAFRERHPKLKVGLFSGTSPQIKAELAYDRCRLGLFYTPVKASEPLESRQIHETEFWVVIARRNRWVTRARPLLADLRRAGVPRIESRHRDYASGFPAHFHSKTLGLTEAPWIEVNQHEVKKQLVLGGFGYSLMVRHSVEEEVRSGKLVRVGAPRRLSAPIYAVWRKGRGIDRVSEAFLADFVASVLK